MAHYSLNEIEASARKASRGAGMTWGLAEEAGKATRWLAARGLPNISILLPLLKINDGKAYHSLCPQDLSSNWGASGGYLCPVIAGSTLNDLAHNIVLGQEFRLEAVYCPALVLPILGRAAKALRQGFRVSWDDVSIKITPDKLCLEQGTRNDLAATFSDMVRVSGLPSSAELSKVHVGGQIIERVVQGVALSDQDWNDLQIFAARTYVPASDQSRLLGAGAGLTDND